MVIFHRSGKGCVKVVVKMEEGEEIPNIEQLMLEYSELFEDEEEEEVDEFEE